MKQKEVVCILSIFFLLIVLIGCTKLDKKGDNLENIKELEARKELSKDAEIASENIKSAKIETIKSIESKGIISKASPGPSDLGVTTTDNETGTDTKDQQVEIKEVEEQTIEAQSKETDITVQQPEITEQKQEIPAGTVALFFTEGLTSIKERLPVQVQYTNIEGGGYATNIQWESSTSAVVRYLPKLQQVDLMKTGTSTSWSQNSMYPFTSNGRFFVLRDWGSEWNAKNNQWTLTEIDPKTGSVVQETGFNADSFGIVEDKIYFSTGKMTDFYGRITSYGKLKVMNLGESSSYYATDLFSFTEDIPSGQLYGVGNNLMSITTQYIDGKTIATIRKHDLNTGEPTIVFNDLTLTYFSQEHIFPGQDALYIGIEYEGSIWFQKFSIDGESITIPVELERLGNNPRGFLTQDNDKLIFAEADGFEVKTLAVFDVNTGNLENINIEPFQGEVSFPRVGFAALIVE